VAAALLLPPSVAAQQSPRERLPLADSLAAWYALGINAHHLCAGLWVVGRDHERSPAVVVAEDIAPFPAFRWGDDFTYESDAATGRATVHAPGIGSRTAKYSGDQGCAIVPHGAEDVYFEPVAVSPGLPDPREQDWPTGDRGAFGSVPPAVESALEAALDWAFDDTGREQRQNTRGVVIVHGGRIVGERYAPGWGPQTPQISWSMGKSIAAALVGVLVQQGELSLEQPAPVEAWQGARDPRRAIRIADLLQMSSGLDFDNFGLDPRHSYSAANEHFRVYFDAVDAYAHAVHQPLRHEPGAVWRYLNSDPLTLMHIVRETVEARGGSLLDFPQRHLFDRIGARSMVLETDAWGNFIITGFDYGSTRDWARFGLLHLQDGVWEGERILPEGWVDFVRTPAPADPRRAYGGQFWLNRGGAMPRIPEDSYWAAGYMGQQTLIVPSRNLVIARHGPSAGGFNAHFEELTARVLDALEQRRGRR
jgi:CubicO group peptidase (beta-lactamase class C family)